MRAPFLWRFCEVPMRSGKPISNTRATLSVTHGEEAEGTIGAQGEA